MTSTRYPYFAISFGAISLFFSIAALLTSAGLQFQFGYAKGHVNLIVGDTFFNTVAWFVVLIGFLAYPVIVREARSSRLVLLAHGTILALLVSTVLWSQAFLLLGIANILAYLIALRECPRA